jgi:hypothetical protein
MKITVKWDDHDHALLWFITEKPWTWDEYHQAVDAGIALVRSVDFLVDVILMGTPTVLPTGSALANFLRVTRKLPENVGVIVVVTDSQFLWTINTLLFKISARAREVGALAHSVEEAHAIIADHRAKRSVQRSEGPRW